jgi:hypothetical protein
MRLFIRYFITMTILLGMASIAIPAWFHMPYPKPLGPRFDPSIRLLYQREINQQRPRLVLTGDSGLVYGVDSRQLQKETGVDIYNLGFKGSASATWYLVAKNAVAPSTPRPITLVIFFRDTILTTPEYRVDAVSFTQIDTLTGIDRLAGRDESVLIQRAYVNRMNTLEKLADQYFPPFSGRLVMRQTFNERAHTLLPKILAGCDVGCTDAALSPVFFRRGFENQLLKRAVSSAEDYLYTPDKLDFELQLPRSFLPEIVRLCKENGIQLILVRMKTLNFPVVETEPRALSEYISDLRAYLDQNDVVLLDFSHDVRLTSAHFLDAVHMNAEGRAVFTPMLADALRPYLP